MVPMSSVVLFIALGISIKTNFVHAAAYNVTTVRTFRMGHTFLGYSHIIIRNVTISF